MSESRFASRLTEQIANEFAASQQYIAIAVYYDADALPQLAGLLLPAVASRSATTR